MPSEREEIFAYLREVERFWLLLRRRGLMLSPKDVQQVEEWAAAEIPSRVVCRALLEGADRFRERNSNDREFPNSLRYFCATVEESARRFAASQLDMGNESVSELVFDDEGAVLDAKLLLPPIVEAGRKTPDERVRQAYRNAYRALDKAEETDASALLDRLVDIDRSIIDDVLVALREDERSVILDEVEAALVEERDMLGELGLRERQRALLEDIVTRRWDLLRLVPGPLDGPRVLGMGWGRLVDER